ncbi:MAG TPA: FAD-linked oxidase C-terminal domain-containing protein [Gaiellaceae bacterium]|nr:FAD-linked oxidase C-terminal domain-containing protein [Gaiellaceae bacterium]
MTQAQVDRRALAAELRAAIEGDVRFDTASRALYATDASNYRQPPIGVVLPRTLDDVVAVHGICREHGAPLTPRGCGTSLSGETVNVAVILDCSKYLTGIGDVDPERRLVSVEPGAINEHVNRKAGRHRLVFGPDPSTHAYCTIGGNVGNNSCGAHSVQAMFLGEGGRTSDNVHSLEILTYDGLRLRVGATPDDDLDGIVAQGGRRGEIYAGLRDLRNRYADLIRERFPPIPRRVSGYNLDDLLPERGFNVARSLVGTEGTCVTVLEATLQLIPDPPSKCGVVLGYDDIAAAGDHVMEALAHRPLAVEGFDDLLVELEREASFNVEALDGLPQGRGWMYVELGGETTAEAGERARALLAELEPEAVAGKLVEGDDARKQLAQLREVGLAMAAFPRGEDHWEGWEDSAVPPERIGDYLRDLRGLAKRHGFWGTYYGHLGQGCMHVRYDFDLRSKGGVQKFRAFVEEAADLCVSYGGSLSGEHGDGQARAELLHKQYGEELVGAFREFKRIWDPDGKMNPGKVVDPYRLDENLKLGPDHDPWRPTVKFSYPEDKGDFAHATLRCVGVGRCRRPDGMDVMCPSFMATREEMHSTRGRTRLLFEMLEGEVITDGWQSDEVMEALDLCLSCKGCTHDCPVDVDMPTYKAEFLHNRWKHRLRPRHAYAFGLIDQVSRVASRAPGLVNFLTHTPPFAQAFKLAAGMTQQRAVPTFAPLTLQQWFKQRGGTTNPAGRKVVLFPDTFNNRMHTDVGVAAVEALEAAGWQVIVPAGHVCCGRPLYDYGFLDLAERYLRRSLDQLREWYREGIPIVGLEPSCVAVFRDELGKFMPHDDDAKRLAQGTYHFAEFFEQFEVEPPRLERKAFVWGHCHHKATGGIDPEVELLQKMGVEVDTLTAGCCGLAGSWGFEAAHHEVSLTCGEQGLLPKVRELDDETLVVADGFSCKTQIEQGKTGRRALHLAQVLKLAREYGASGPSGPRPERLYYEVRPQPSLPRRAARAAVLVGAAALALGFVSATMRRREAP